MTTANDAAAYKKIYDTRAERLKIARARAEKWIAGLTALVTILTTAMVVEGPESFKKADSDTQFVVLAVILLGGVGLAIGLFGAYVAAFGGIVRRSAVDQLLANPPTRADGAAAELERAATADATTSEKWMRVALVGTIGGMFFLMTGVAIAWQADAEPKDPDVTCVMIGDQLLTVTGGLSVETGSVTFVECAE